MLTLNRKKALTSDQEVVYLLHKLHSSLSRRGEAVLQDKFGLGMSQFLILMAADRAEHASQCKIARFLNVTEAAVSRQIDSLTEQGWLTKVTNPTNRREHVLQVTEQGLAQLDGARAALEGMYADLFRVLSHDEQDKLRKILGKLQQAVCPAEAATTSPKEGK